MLNANKIALLFCILISTAVFSNHANTLVNFYYLKCLSKSSTLLSFLDKHHYCYQLCNCACQEQCVQIDATLFFDEKIICCIQNMMHTASLKPVIQLSHDIKNYTENTDEQFIRELFVLIFTVHKQILLDTCKSNPQALKTGTLNTILEISEKINQLPIAEVLNAIDMLITELPPFLEKYEFNSKISWKEWLKKYWWVPPIFGGWFVLKVLLSLQRPHYYFSPYLSPRPTPTLPPIITNDPVLQEIIVDPTSHKAS